MKKQFLVSLIAILMFFNNAVFAADMLQVDDVFKDNITPKPVDFSDCFSNNRKGLLSAASDNPQALDYSRLDNILTVEVENVATAKNHSLIVVEYNTADLPINIHIVCDVKEKNVIGKVYGEYERAFLWSVTDMRPACKPISTKTDYEIIEGAEGDWSVSSDGHTLYSYLGKDTDVIIPNSYCGKRITGIYNQPAVANITSQTTYAQLSLFEGRNDIKSFIVPEGIVILGPYAFASCEANCPITIPDTVKYIGAYAFRGCKNLTGSVDLSSVTNFQQDGGFQFAYCTALDGTLTLPNVEIIPKGAFYDCRNLTGGITIPNSVKVIDDFAFCCTGAANITSLILSDSLVWIGKAAFQFQTKIANVLILPEGLKHISDGAFNHCTSIPNRVLTIPSSLEIIGGDYTGSDGNYTNTGYGCHVFYHSFRQVLRFEVAIGNAFFKEEDGVLYSKDGTRLIAYPPAKSDGEFAVPEGVTQIDEMAFGYSKFETLTLPDSYVISESVPNNVINNKANTLAVAMYHYNSLKSVAVNDTNPNYVSVDGILYSKDKSKLWYVPPKITGEVVVEDGCTEMMSGSCWMEVDNYDGELYTSIFIPKSVSAIHANTLSDLNRKISNSEQRFIINLDSENSSFIIDQDGRICKKYL